MTRHAAKRCLTLFKVNYAAWSCSLLPEDDVIISLLERELANESDEMVGFVTAYIIQTHKIPPAIDDIKNIINTMHAAERLSKAVILNDPVMEE